MILLESACYLITTEWVHEQAMDTLQVKIVGVLVDN